MTSKELIDQLATTSGLNRDDASLAYYALLHVLTSALQREGEVSIPDLGTLAVERQPAAGIGGRGRLLFTPEANLLKFCAAYGGKRRLRSDDPTEG